MVNDASLLLLLLLKATTSAIVPFVTVSIPFVPFVTVSIPFVPIFPTVPLVTVVTVAIAIAMTFVVEPRHRHFILNFRQVESCEVLIIWPICCVIRSEDKLIFIISFISAIMLLNFVDITSVNVLPFLIFINISVMLVIVGAKVHELGVVIEDLLKDRIGSG